MVKYGGWDILMLPEPLSICSGGFSYIFFITLHPVTFISVDDSTFFSIGSLSLGAIRRLLKVWFLWSRLALHICCMFFSNFHSALCNMAPLFKDFGFGCLCCCSYSSYGFFGLMFSFWSSPCWVPKQGTCILLRLYVNVLLLAVAALGLNIWC